jgi:DinB superfamily
LGEPEPRFSSAAVLDMLESAPARIAAATSGVPEEYLIEPLEPGGWSARDVLGHVRACDRTWGGYLDRILDEDRPTFRAESPRSTIRRFDFLTLPFGPSLEAFTGDRARLVARLHSIDADRMMRTASVNLPGRGTEERTAAYYAHRLAEHEREHVRHLEQAMAARGS